MVPGAGDQRRESSRREAILTAALELFHERGYVATGIDEIGTAAGITGPGVYRHFHSKEEILATLMRNFGEPILAEVDQIVASDLEPLEALDAMARAFLAALIDHPSLAEVGMFERHMLSESTRAWVEAVEARTISGWAGIVRRLRPHLTESEARVVVQAAATVGLSACNYDSSIDRATLMGIVHPMVMVVCGAPAAPA